MDGESTAAWRRFLDDRDASGPKRPECAIVPSHRLRRNQRPGDGWRPGLEAALVALWGEDLPSRGCPVRTHRNLLGEAPKHMQDELTEDHRDVTDAETAAGIETRRKAFLRKWRLRCGVVADGLDEAGDRLFTFARPGPSHWTSARTTTAIERSNGDFRRRITTRTNLPCARTAPMLLRALQASEQIRMRKVDDRETLSQPPQPMPLDRAARETEPSDARAHRKGVSTASAT